MGAIVNAATAGKSCPPVLKEIMARAGYNYHKASDISGVSYSYLANIFRGSAKAPPTLVARLKDALERHKKGQPPPAKVAGIGNANALRNLPPIEQLDKGELGIAIVLVDSKKLETIFAAGESVGGKWVYRRKMGGTWLLIMRHADKKALQMFRMLGKIGADVITP